MRLICMGNNMARALVGRSARTHRHTHTHKLYNELRTNTLHCPQKKINLASLLSVYGRVCVSLSLCRSKIYVSHSFYLNPSLCLLSLCVFTCMCVGVCVYACMRVYSGGFKETSFCPFCLYLLHNLFVVNLHDFSLLSYINN